jgi:hypothetical protein
MPDLKAILKAAPGLVNGFGCRKAEAEQPATRLPVNRRTWTRPGHRYRGMNFVVDVDPISLLEGLSMNLGASAFVS